ncbi:GNAT family N-acetyltransferase [Bacillus songklensis]|uniref:GNAT family N-acetyltransferase n=1 Tax=Bacillus songklensis TaxID=1069116 RepID=A0ABV8B5Y1_9BACI
MLEGVQTRNHLNGKDIQAIVNLADICNRYEQINITIPLNLSILRNRDKKNINDFLYFSNGRLTGFLGMYSFADNAEVEMTVMVHPDFRKRNIASTLLNEASKQWEIRGINRRLLVVDRSSLSGQAFVRTIGAGYEFSEYSMVLDLNQKDTLNEKTLDVIPAARGDIVQIKAILMEGFSFSDEQATEMIQRTTSDPKHRLYIAKTNSTPIGTVTVSENEQELYIRAFTVLPSYQGKGYGRQILSQLIKELHNQTDKEIMIEVETENANALHLYESCGFHVNAGYDYYSI